MNININKETKFNIGDEVYLITNNYIYNDWERDETEWQIFNDMNRKPKKLKILEIGIEYYIDIKNNENNKIYYRLKGLYCDKYSEVQLFKTLEEAEQKCKELNKPSYL